METKDFLDLVLPRAGLRVVAVPGDRGFKHVFVSTNAFAADSAHKLDVGASKNVYFACATYLTPTTRKGDNVAAARSFWMDIDVGETKPYATRRGAFQALVAFTQAVAIPLPLVVRSGSGLHVYWPMAEDLTPDQWRGTAVLLKAAATAQGLGQDPTRTADIASVLRPVGTHHRKGEPRLVEVVGYVPPPIPWPAFHAALEAFCDAAGLTPQVMTPRTKKRLAINDDLSGGMDDYPPVFASIIADKCAVVRRLRDEPTDQSQPEWFGVLGVMAFAEDGDALAHQWGSAYPGYSPAETDAKLAQVRGFKPTSCAKLGDYQSALCAACPHQGKIKSPIVLGVEGPKPQPVTPTPRQVDPFAPTTMTPEEDRLDAEATRLTEDMPEGFAWGVPAAGGRMALLAEIKEHDEAAGTWTSEMVPFCDTLFFPVSRLNEGDNRFTTEIEYRVRGEVRYFTVPTAMIAAGGRDLAKLLGEREIIGRPKMKTHVDNYLQGWIKKLQDENDETRMHQHFGWVDNDDGHSFVLGDRIITPAGDETVVLQGLARDMADAVQPRGSYEVWRSVIERAYNYPGQEDYQYQVLLSFAAILWPMFRQYGGVTVYAHSEKTGTGKTTAQRAGLAAWGNWDRMQMSDQKVTINMLWANIGMFHNLPVVFDELTNQKSEVTSDLVFSVSSGRQKQRMTADGGARKNNANWSTIVMTSGNNLLSEKLGLHRANAEAELARLFEFTMRSESILTPNEANELFPLLLDNYGHAGIRFARHVVDNYEEVEAKLLATQRKLNDLLNVTQGERYWSALQAAVVVALRICRTLDIVQFDETGILQWVATRFAENRRQRDESVSSPLEQMGSMLAEMIDGILVTHGQGDMRKKPPARAQVLHHPRGSLIGRSIVPLGDNERAVLLLNGVAIKAWCYKNGVSAREMFIAARQAGWVERETKRYALGMGTQEYANVSGPVQCWVIDPMRVGAGSSSVSEKLQVLTGQVAAGGD